MEAVEGGREEEDYINLLIFTTSYLVLDVVVVVMVVVVVVQCVRVYVRIVCMCVRVDNHHQLSDIALAGKGGNDITKDRS